MKSEIKIKEKTRLVYPKLMINIENDRVVLFVDDKIGTLIWESVDYYGVGHYSNNWCMDTFTEFYGEITIKN